MATNQDLETYRRMTEDNGCGMLHSLIAFARRPNPRVFQSMGAGESTMASAAVKQSVDNLIKSNKVMIFSKSYCPYCTKAKKVFENVGEEYGLVELDEAEDGGSMQNYLAELTGGRTVPRVFIRGKCIGGGTETEGLYRSGQLKTMLA